MTYTPHHVAAADRLYRELVCAAGLFHVAYYGEGTAAQRAQCQRLWRRAMREVAAVS